MYSGKKSGLRTRTVKVFPAGSSGGALGPAKFCSLPVSNQIPIRVPYLPVACDGYLERRGYRLISLNDEFGCEGKALPV